ncbi:MAG TPA: ice-binding family protein [Polyangiaceae bacterium]
MQHPTATMTGAAFVLLSLGAAGCSGTGGAGAPLPSDAIYSVIGEDGGTGTLAPQSESVDGGSAPDGVAPVGSPLPVNLGLAGSFAILARSGISTVPPSAITGNLGVGAAGAYITGFSLTTDRANGFSTSPQVLGSVYAADDASPTPATLVTAVGDMQAAFTDAAGRAPNVTDLGAGNLGGMTLQPGVYRWGTDVSIPANVTLFGRATDVWIFQIAQTLTVASTMKVSLIGGALAKNVFWQVSGTVDLGKTSHLEGVILGQTAITLHLGASIQGRLLAQTVVNLDSSTVVQPAP